jgi:hypothetical protein
METSEQQQQEWQQIWADRSTSSLDGVWKLARTRDIIVKTSRVFGALLGLS